MKLTRYQKRRHYNRLMSSYFKNGIFTGLATGLILGFAFGAIVAGMIVT